MNSESAQSTNADGGESSNELSGTTDIGATDMESVTDLSLDDMGDASNDAIDGYAQPTTSVESIPVFPATTRVEFDITVPAYMSDQLQVRLSWGAIESTASWTRDESWTASVTLPTDTENLLVVTFYDRRGAITLGSVEKNFRTGTGQSQTVRISADQFNTQRWDSDNDGVSNLDELIAGGNPSGQDLPQPVQVRLELLPIKTFRISWEAAPSAQFYRVLENPDSVSGFTDVSGQLGADSTSFDLYAALYLKVNAQYMVQACNDHGCAYSEPVMVTGTLDDAIGYFKASNNSGGGKLFGGEISLSADGNTMAVSAVWESSAATGINSEQPGSSAETSGAVYVFSRSGSLWQQQAYIKASNAEADDWFGGSLSLSADGNTLAVSAIQESSAATRINGEQNDNSLTDAGAVYVFQRSGELWQQHAYIKPSTIDENDKFGWNSLHLSADGNTLAVGVALEDSAATGVNGDEGDNSQENSGAVYVFVRRGLTWQQQAYIKASNTDEEDVFGWSVSLSADGNKLAVGARSEQSAATGINGNQSDNSIAHAGAVYVFVRAAGLWQQQAYIKASNTGLADDLGRADGFGFKVAMSADGSTLAASAIWEKSAATGVNGDEDDDSANRSGAVYVFIANEGIWQQQAYVKASNTELQDFFGSSISLSANGDTLAVGAHSEDSSARGVNGDDKNNSVSTDASGAAFVFLRSSGQWRQQAYIKASNPGREDKFGGEVSLSADGGTLAVGAAGEGSSASGINGYQDSDSFRDSGAVYLY